MGMTDWTESELITAGYVLQNALITRVDLTTLDHSCLTLEMTLEGQGFGVIYGGISLGRGYVGAKEFEGSAKGNEYIMRVMDTVGSDSFIGLEGKYVRVAIKDGKLAGAICKIIGHIIEDKWFDPEKLFKE